MKFVMLSNLQKIKDSGAGFILRDKNGLPTLASTKKLGQSNVICDEASSLRAGLQTAQ